MPFENAYEKCHECQFLSEYCFDYPRCKDGFHYCEAWVEWLTEKLDMVGDEGDALFSVPMPPEWWMEEFSEEPDEEESGLLIKCPSRKD